MGVRVLRIGRDALTGERQRAAECLVERRDGFGRRGRKRRFAPRHAAHVIVDRHVAAPERDAEPQRAGQAAKGARVQGIGHRCLPERFLGLRAVQAIEFPRRLSPQPH